MKPNTISRGKIHISIVSLTVLSALLLSNVLLAQQRSEEDKGSKPWVIDIEETTIDNQHYRHVRWTGKNMQLVFMSLNPGETIDLEVHSNIDQFIRIEQGDARVVMGKDKEQMDIIEEVSDDFAILIPAGYWHMIVNTGDSPLKVYSIYTPAEHPAGTLHQTYKEGRDHHHEH